MKHFLCLLFAVCLFRAGAGEAWKETEIAFGLPEWPLKGTLTVPTAGGGPFPLAVLVHGSGPQDRDETIGPNRPFRDIAHGLAEKGVATLRYDKRTRLHGGRIARLKHYTLKDEVIDDVVLAVAFAAARPEADPARIFVLGHSLGGMLLPRIATETTIPAGYIFLAAPARPLKEVMGDQLRYLLRQQTGQANEFAVSAELAKIQRSVPAGYWKEFSEYAAVEDAKTLDRPMLFLQGGRDYQVTVADFEIWQAAFKDRPAVSFRLYRDLNHLMQKGIGKSLPQEYMRLQPVDPRVIDDIAAFTVSRPDMERTPSVRKFGVPAL